MRIDGDGECTFGSIVQAWSGRGSEFPCGIDELELKRTRALHLEPVVKDLVACECLSAKALARVVELDCVQGWTLIRNRRLHEWRMTARKRDKWQQPRKGARSHRMVLRSRIRAVSTTPVLLLCRVMGKASTFHTHSSPRLGRLRSPRKVRSM